MNSAFLVFPNQLFENPVNELRASKVLLIEDDLFFGQYRFHKQKLIFHRASMKAYANYLHHVGCNVNYMGWSGSLLEDTLKMLSSTGVTQIQTYETVDYLLNRRLKRYCEGLSIHLSLVPNPSFLSDPAEDLRLLGKSRNYLMGRFYTKQRLKYDILVEAGQPIGGKWSFDEENRKKLPKNISPPPTYMSGYNKYKEEAKEYVALRFPNALGNDKCFIYGISHKEARDALGHFLEHRFHAFGAYQDAITQRSDFVFHSVLSPYLNSGLLSPKEVVDHAIEYAREHQVPMNSLEGFIRQLIGWREYLMLLYKKESVFMRTRNFFGFKREMPSSFYEGSTGIKPIDDSIKKLHDHAYNHHIERLMLLGNFMLLCEIDPDEVYRWFMEFYIDSYDWVMVPNVYGMSQYADGGLICTKPYVSGSNYVHKMSDYPKSDWSETWNALYWRFIHVNRNRFDNNPRMGMMLRLLDRMNKEKLKGHLKLADNFLEQLN